MKESENIVLDKSFAFSVRIVKLYKYLAEGQKEYILSKQILRSGTSIGANLEEADGGFSKADFTAKVGIAYKEAKETHYWLRLLHETGYIEKDLFESLVADCTEICKLTCAIIKSSRN